MEIPFQGATGSFIADYSFKNIFTYELQNSQRFNAFLEHAEEFNSERQRFFVLVRMTLFTSSWCGTLVFGSQIHR